MSDLSTPSILTLTALVYAILHFAERIIGRALTKGKNSTAGAQDTAFWERRFDELKNELATVKATLEDIKDGVRTLIVRRR